MAPATVTYLVYIRACGDGTIGAEQRLESKIRSLLQPFFDGQRIPPTIQDRIDPNGLA